MSIPLIAIEEHHEAFFVWYHAREVGWLGDSGNTLVHVDEHADQHPPWSRLALPGRRDAVAAANYTYTSLNIANFIWPSVYVGLFAKVYWLRRQHQREAGAWRRIRVSFVPERTPFAWRVSECASLAPLTLAAHEVACEYAPLQCGDRLRPTTPVALDIDLDYFAVNDPPQKPQRRWRLDGSFAREIRVNPYHWARLEGQMPSIEQHDDGQWTMTLPDDVTAEVSAVVNGPDVAAPLAEFAAWLDQFHIRPAVITICRSQYSGYAPVALVREIESRVRVMLHERFAIEEHSLNAILPETRKVPAHLLRTWPW